MNRRRFLERVVQGFTAVGAGFVIYPFIKAWIPDFKQDVSMEVAIDDLAPGQAKLVHWLGRNIVIRRRSRTMLAALDTDTPRLKDPASTDSNQPGFARNEYRSRKPEVFVAYNNCTHLGCEVNVVDHDGVGFKCPCHQSDYDYAGRVMIGAAAPLNLEVPWYEFTSDRKIRFDLKEPS